MKILAASLIAALTVGCGATIHRSSSSPVRQPSTISAASTAHTRAWDAACPSTPVTAGGYQRLFSTLDPAQWGGADVSISVHMRTGVTVWLYGDTVTTHTSSGYAHSTAILQHNGCVHVSHRGAQLLPNEGRYWYWVDSAHSSGSNILVRAERIQRSSNGLGFKPTGFFRTALVTVGHSDVTFSRWISSDRQGETKMPLTKTMMECHTRLHGSVQSYPTQGQLCPTNHEVSYNPSVHSWAHLKSGKTLITVQFNNLGPFTGHFSDYRPRFYEVNQP